MLHMANAVNCDQNQIDDGPVQPMDMQATVSPNDDGNIVKKEPNDDDDRFTPSSITSNSSCASKQNQLFNYEKSIRDQQRSHLLSASILLSSRSRHTPPTELNDMLQSAVPPGYLLPCPLCDAPLEPRLFRQHLDRHYPRDSPICPVLQCGRRFAHPNSVRNHMRIKHTMQWAKMKAMRSSGGPFSSAGDFK